MSLSYAVKKAQDLGFCFSDGTIKSLLKDEIPKVFYMYIKDPLRDDRSVVLIHEKLKSMSFINQAFSAMFYMPPEVRDLILQLPATAKFNFFIDDSWLVIHEKSMVINWSSLTPDKAEYLRYFKPNIGLWLANLYHYDMIESFLSEFPSYKFADRVRYKKVKYNGAEYSMVCSSIVENEIIVMKNWNILEDVLSEDFSLALAKLELVMSLGGEK